MNSQFCFVEFEKFLINKDYLSFLIDSSFLKEIKNFNKLEDKFPLIFSRKKRYRTVKAFRLDSLEIFVKKYEKNLRESENEWKNILLLWKKGFPTSVPIFFYKEKSFSLVGTKKISGILCLEIIKQDPSKTSKIVKLIANFLGKLHKEKLFHQDCYLNHFYIDLEKEEVYILDVSRVMYKPIFSFYYQVKDLAQIKFSFFKYFGDRFQDLWKSFLEEYSCFHKLNNFKNLLIMLKFYRIKAHTKNLENYEKDKTR